MNNAMQQPLQWHWLNGLESISAAEWNALLPDSGYPFLRHDLLLALEQSGSVSRATGWQPQHWTARQGGKLVAALPLYQKFHSRGEYVFDFQWAEAYPHFMDPQPGNTAQSYYPKLLSAVPFTPAQGPRLLLKDEALMPAVLASLAEALQQQFAQGLSGWHLLFAEASQVKQLRLHWPQLLERHACQFHWFNRGYADFEEFLAGMTSKRRKEIRRERRKVAEQGLVMKRVPGALITAAQLQTFYHCYQTTYALRGQRGYLTLDFFERLLTTMPEQLLLVLAEHQGQPVAAALFFQDATTLYGRYWGALVEADCLHFEACYYQGIEYAIEQGLQRFDPGTQGEHKISRGFEPVMTHSLHWLPNASFAAAVDDFLRRERPMVAAYCEDAKSLLPFHRVVDSDR